MMPTLRRQARLAKTIQELTGEWAPLANTADFEVRQFRNRGVLSFLFAVAPLVPEGWRAILHHSLLLCR